MTVLLGVLRVLQSERDYVESNGTWQIQWKFQIERGNLIIRSRASDCIRVTGFFFLKYGPEKKYNTHDSAG